jgi:hypothetical protein
LKPKIGIYDRYDIYNDRLKTDCMRRTSVETKNVGERFRDIEKSGAGITQNEKIYIQRSREFRT